MLNSVDMKKEKMTDSSQIGSEKDDSNLNSSPQTESEEENDSKFHASKIHDSKNDESNNKVVNTTVSMIPIADKGFTQKGKLMKGDTLTIELEDVEQYINNKENLENMKDQEYKTPFIIYLNSKFVDQVKVNKRLRRTKKLIIFAGIVLLILASVFLLAKILNKVG